MKIGLLKLRMSRRLSMPPEVVFALTRHWVLIFLFAVAGAFASYAHAVTQAPYYLGSATLLFANEPVMVGYGRTDARRAQERSLSANVQMLLSESVLRKLVQAVKPANAPPDSPPPAEKEQGGVRRVIHSVFELAANARDAVLPRGQEEDNEQLRLQRAVAAFRERSEVRPSPQTNTVVLRVRGSNRDLVERELEEWTKAFISHLLEMAEQGSNAFVTSRKEYWQDLEEKARQAAEDFRRANPQATKTNQDLAFRELTQLQVMRLDAQRGPQPTGGRQPQEAVQPAEDPERTGLLAHKRTIEAELIQNMPLYTDDSYKIAALRQSLAIVESKLEATEPEAAAPPEDVIRKLDESIVATMNRYTMISERLEKLEALEDEIKRYEGTRKSYEMLDMERQDKEELSKNVQVQVSDKPQVGWLPNAVNTRARAAMGGLAGLVLSAVLAVFVEAVGGKARFKSDITGEFGLPVLAVIPRK